MTPTAVAPAAAATTTTSGPHRRFSRALLLAVVFVVAACGLVYELALISLGSFLVGASVRETSIVLGVLVFAMGIGSLSAKPLLRWPVKSFAAVEIAIGLIGGLSVAMLYGAFAWLNLYRIALIALSLILGFLIGLELPLLMELLQRIRNQDASEATSDLFAADYIGALIGGLAFPFLLLPVFGQLVGAVTVGLVNLAAASILILGLFRGDLSRRARWLLTAAFITAAVVLALVGAGAGRYEVRARQALFADPIVHSERTNFQEIVVTEAFRFNGRRDLRLFLNGDLQFASIDEYRYHETLVHPALAGNRTNVLVLGGGDGLAVREILRYDDVERIVLVELDPAVIELARSHPAVTELNENALDDPRVEVITADAFQWLRTNNDSFDAAIVDMPDADDVATAKLYSVEFYGLVRNRLAPDGVMIAQSGSPFFAPEAFWSIEASVREAGLVTVPLHVDVPSFGNWGFILAGVDGRPKVDVSDQVAVELKFLDRPTLSAATVFPVDRGPLDMQPSTLLDPIILEYAALGWRGE